MIVNQKLLSYIMQSAYWEQTDGSNPSSASSLLS